MKKLIKDNSKQILISLAIAVVITAICMFLGMRHSAQQMTDWGIIIVPETFQGFPFVWHGIYKNIVWALVADILIYFIGFFTVSFGAMKIFRKKRGKT